MFSMEEAVAQNKWHTFGSDIGGLEKLLRDLEAQDHQIKFIGMMPGKMPAFQFYIITHGPDIARNTTNYIGG